MIRSVQKKRPTTATLKKRKGAKGFNSKKIRIIEEKQDAPLSFHLFLVEQKRGAALSEQWTKNNVIHFPEVKLLPFTGYSKDPKYRHFHGKKATG